MKKDITALIPVKKTSDRIKDKNIRRFSDTSLFELKLKQIELPYERRDHALFTAFAPYKNPRYAITVVVEHGGSGSSGAAPIAKKLIKKILDRHQERKKIVPDLFQEA